MQSRTRTIVAEGLVAALGMACLIAAGAANRAWFERHFLEEFFRPRAQQLAVLNGMRAALAALGIAILLWMRPAFGRLAGRRGFARLGLDCLPIMAAIVAALVVTKLTLDHGPWRPRRQAPAWREPLRHWDDRIGWVHTAGRTGRAVIAGRAVEYVLDADGHRVRTPSEPVDYAAPAVLFLGESIIEGHGLRYEETIPAQVEARTGIRSANLAVGGYALDQMYLSFVHEWPRFRRPAAVVLLFMPPLFHRNLEIDRPHVAKGLVWRPASREVRMVEVLHRLAPYRSAREIAEAKAAAREQLTAITSMARARGAIPLVLALQLDPETAEQAALRHEILDKAQVPYVVVRVDPTWRLQGDRHPDARAAAKVGEAVAFYLSAHGVRGPPRHP